MAKLTQNAVTEPPGLSPRTELLYRDVKCYRDRYLTIFRRAIRS